MLVGVPKEIKDQEYRIGLTPAGVNELVVNGHQVIVQKGGAVEIGFDDRQYAAAGATLVDKAEELFSRAELIIKVKEPQPEECRMLKKGQTLFTYLHLAPDPRLAELLLTSRATCVAYETVTDARGGLPLLAPMSEVAGRLSVQAGAHHLEKINGGMGCLLGGVPGVPPANVLIIGGGVVGTQAAIIALGMGASVTVVDKSLPRLRQLDSEFGGRVKTVYATAHTIAELAVESDLIIGAVLIPGAATPKLVTREMVTKMKKGAVIVDVAIDQGGCFETSKPTTHQKPTYVIDDVIHYCVANLPSGAARTSTMALTNATLPYVLKLADQGVEKALMEDNNLMNGLNLHNGVVTHKAVAEALGHVYVDGKVALAG